MLKRRHLFVISTAIIIIAPAVMAQKPPQMPKDKFSSAGEIKAIQMGVFHVKNVGGDEWMVKVEAKPEDVIFQGSAAVNWLRAGMLVEFKGVFDKKGKGQEPITKLKVFSPREDTEMGAKKEAARGSFISKRATDEPQSQSATYNVSGMLTNYSKGKMTVSIGMDTAQAELADDAEITVDISDFRFARVGDEIEFEGWHYLGQKQHIHATRVAIQASAPLGTEEKKRRSGTTSKTKPSKDVTSRGPSEAQRERIRKSQQAISKASQLYDDGKYDEAIQAVEEILADWKALTASGNSEVIRLLGLQFNRLKRVHSLLELEGCSLPSLEKPK